LVYRGRLLGMFTICSDRPRRFDADELAFAATVGCQIAFALETQRSESQLSATLNAVSEAITVQSPDGRLVLGNEAAAALLGFASVDELLAAGLTTAPERFEMRDLEGRPLAPEQLPGRAALRGEEPPEVLVRWRSGPDDRERVSLVRAQPVFDDAGGVAFAVNVCRDVTQRQQALEEMRASEARLAFLASAGQRLFAAPLDAAKVLEVVVDIVVPELGDWCSVRDFPDRSGPRKLVFGYRNDDVDAEVITGVNDYRDTKAPSQIVNELRGGRSVLLDGLTPEILEQAAVNAEHLALLERLDLRSAMVIPLRARGRLIGTLSIGGAATRASYTAADMALAEELAFRVAATVENARSYEREHATAETLARAFMPGRLPDIPGLDVAARYRPAGDVGGDFYDCFPVGEGSWMVVLGDVCGRGIKAAAMTGLTRHSVRAAALHADSLVAVLDDVNRLLVEAGVEHMAAGERDDCATDPSFCTLCLARFTPTATGARVDLVSAGHPLPFVVRADGTVAKIGTAGSLLGVMANIDSIEEAVELGAGDAVVLFTDGITERREQRQFFEDQLPATLRGATALPAASLAERVEHAALSFTATAPDDDMAIVVVSVPLAQQTPKPAEDAAARPTTEMSEA
jgi:PAS domain S-box-containing protein